MFTATFFKCEQCDATIKASQLKESEWVVFSHPRIAGAMVIRCPEHITSYTWRLLCQSRKEGGAEYSTRHLEVG